MNSKISDYELEFRRVLQNFKPYHDAMRVALDGYNDNFFYAPKPNEPMNYNKGVNLVQVFCDKLWYYTSPFPKISIPSRPDDRENSELREKLLYSVHQKCRAEEQWSKGVFYGNVMSAFPFEVEWHPETGYASWRAVDPRYACWQSGDRQGDTITTFWTFVPKTAAQIKKEYGVDPVVIKAKTYDVYTSDIGIMAMELDAPESYLVVKRTDDETVTVMIGGVKVRQYKHLLPEIPFEMALPLQIANDNKRGTFYIDKLKWQAAEFNDLWRKRSAIINRMGKPVVWARGVNQKTIDNINQQGLESGFIGLRSEGELGLLQLPETRMIDLALTDVFNRMKDLAGFPTATFGEIAGANTSGDALGMYFQPTVRMIDHFNTSYLGSLQRINSKILRFYEKFTPPNTPIDIDGVFSGSYGARDIFASSIMPEQINGRYANVATGASVTPKDDIAYKRYILDAVNSGAISKVTAFDEMGLLNPEDELKQLESEQANPVLNPDGALKVMQGGKLHQELTNPLAAPNGPQGY